MAVDVKPLFRPEAIRPQLQKFHDPDRIELAGTKLASWAKLLASKAGAGKKETELLGEFLRDVFVDALGYVPPPADPYTLRRESLIEVDGKFADAAIGRFGGSDPKCLVMLEGKGPKDPLDRPFAGRKRSAVEQALQYAVQERTDWYIVTNLVETRLYHKGNNTFTYEAFETSRMAWVADVRRYISSGGLDGILARQCVRIARALRTLRPKTRTVYPVPRFVCRERIPRRPSGKGSEVGVLRGHVQPRGGCIPGGGERAADRGANGGDSQGH